MLIDDSPGSRVDWPWPGVDIYAPVLILRPERVTIGPGTRIDSFVKLEGGQGLTIGRYVHIASFAHVNIGGGAAQIGDGVAICSGAKVLSGSNHQDGLSMSAAAPEQHQVIKRTTTTIGRFAFVATNAVVLPGVTLGEGAILAAGAVATKDIPAWEIFGGVPARKIGERQPHDTAVWPEAADD
jgi:acetyltransferase-like isoleucine patch superfamily enzyme